MKTIFKSIYTMAVLTLMAGMLASCSSRDDANLDLDGNTRIESLSVSGQAAEINHNNRTVTVNLPVSVDLTRLSVDAIDLSEGATCDYPTGTVFDGTVPRAITVTNGNVYTQYTMTARHDNVEFLTFTLNGQYAGSIDNAQRKVTVFVPIDTDVTAMQVNYTATEGADVTPSSGSLLDFTQPIVFTLSLRTAKVDYTVTVIRDEMSQAPKAFIGNVSSSDALNPEAAAACKWMLDNVPNSRYVSLQEILDGTVKLEDFSMVWCHFDFTDWPSQMWDTRDQFNSYWLHGGAILASRDGARYINDVWRISKNQQSPNNMFGGDSYQTLSDPLGFNISGHEGHALFEGIETDADGRIILLGAGCSNTGRTLQWNVDWGGYGDMGAWETATGAKALASTHDLDPNCVTIAEFEPYEALAGYTSGRVITIGTPAYEWYDRNNTENPYRENIVKLTKNAINLLCK